MILHQPQSHIALTATRASGETTGMDQRDSQATENLQDSVYEACSGRTDHKNTK